MPIRNWIGGKCNPTRFVAKDKRRVSYPNSTFRAVGRRVRTPSKVKKREETEGPMARAPLSDRNAVITTNTFPTNQCAHEVNFEVQE